MVVGVKQSKLDDGISNALHSDKVQIHGYNSIQHGLEKLPSGERIMLDKGQISLDLFKSVSHMNIIHAESPATLLKACKNETEMPGVSNHIADVLDRGWHYATLYFGETQIRTGHIVAAALQSRELRRAYILPS